MLQGFIIGARTSRSALVGRAIVLGRSM